MLISSWTINPQSKQSTYPKCKSEMYVIKEILDSIDRIYEAKPNCTIHIEWVPGTRALREINRPTK